MNAHDFGQELGSHLQDSLHSLTFKGATVDVSITESIDSNAIHTLLEKERVPVVGVYVPINGDVEGHLFLMLSERAACQMADSLCGNPPGTTVMLGEFEESAVNELGNILTGVIITYMGNSFGKSLMLGTPNMAHGTSGALIDGALLGYAESNDQVMMGIFGFGLPAVESALTMIILMGANPAEAMFNSTAVTA